MHLFGRACLCVLLPLSTHLNILSVFDLQIKYFHRTYCITQKKILVCVCVSPHVLLDKYSVLVKMFDFQPWLKVLLCNRAAMSF